VHAAHQDKDTYILKDLNGSVFKHTTAGNNLKPFRVRTAYANAGINIDGQRTTTLLRGDEADNDETDQAEDEAAALEVEREVEVEEENEIFSDESYIPEDRMFAVVV
jgi:hypothetical protein